MISSLEKCKNLRQEVIKELTNASNDQNDNQVSPTRGSSGGSTTLWTNPSSSIDSPLQQPPRASLLYQEHRRLFGYNPRFNPYSRNRPSRQKGFVKRKRVQTWTRQFICLAKRDQTNPPQSWEVMHLSSASPRGRPRADVETLLIVHFKVLVFPHPWGIFSCKVPSIWRSQAPNWI